jgi:uncharacterized protein YceK
MDNYRHAIIAIVACHLAGCGTMHNLDGTDGPLSDIRQKARPRPFGGVAKDPEWTRDYYWPAKPIPILDLPASLVADVVTLPGIRAKQLDYDRRHNEPPVNPTNQASDDPPESD